MINEDGFYEFPLLSYFKTTSSVSIYENCRNYVNYRTLDINKAKTEINEKIDSLVHGLRYKRIGFPTTQGKMIKFTLDNETIMSNGILFFNGYGFNGAISICQLRGVTALSYHYSLNGVTSLILIERSGNNIIFTMPDTSTKIKYIYVVY